MAHKVACQEAFGDKAYLIFCGAHPGVTLDRTESISGHMFSHPADENNNTLAQPAFQHCKDHSTFLDLCRQCKRERQALRHPEEIGKAPRPGLQPS